MGNKCCTSSDMDHDDPVAQQAAAKQAVKRRQWKSIRRGSVDYDTAMTSASGTTTSASVSGSGGSGTVSGSSACRTSPESIDLSLDHGKVCSPLPAPTDSNGMVFTPEEVQMQLKRAPPPVPLLDTPEPQPRAQPAMLAVQKPLPCPSDESCASWRAGAVPQPAQGEPRMLEGFVRVGAHDANAAGVATPSQRDSSAVAPRTILPMTGRRAGLKKDSSPYKALPQRGGAEVNGNGRAPEASGAAAGDVLSHNAVNVHLKAPQPGAPTGNKRPAVRHRVPPPPPLRDPHQLPRPTAAAVIAKAVAEVERVGREPSSMGTPCTPLEQIGNALTAVVSPCDSTSPHVLRRPSPGSRNNLSSLLAEAMKVVAEADALREMEDDEFDASEEAASNPDANISTYFSSSYVSETGVFDSPTEYYYMQQAAHTY